MAMLGADFDWDEHEERTAPDPPTRPARVLVVDDDPSTRALVRRSLERVGYEVIEAADATEVFVENDTFRPSRWPEGDVDLLVVELCLPKRSGLEVLSVLRTGRWTTPAILMTAFPDRDVRRAADFLGVPVLAKPFSLASLTATALQVSLAREAS